MGNNEKTLEYFRNLKYDVVIRKNKDKYILYIREIGLFGEDEILEKAYEKLEFEKEKYFQKMIENDFQDHIGEPEERKIRKTFFGDLAPFFVKLIVILLVLAIFLPIYNINPHTFKYFKKVNKNLVKVSNDISRVLNVEQTTAKIIEVLESYKTAKENRNLLSNFEFLNPVDYYASDNMDHRPVNYAFDSDPSTFWQSMRHLAHLIVKFKRPSKLEALSITLRPDIPGREGPDGYTVKGSNDNKNWESIDAVSQLVWKQGESKTMTVNNNKAYIYYKFNFIKKSITYSSISIAEMELYGNSVVVTEDYIN